MSEPEAYGEIDQSKSITELLELYGISKPTLYGYFKALSITPTRRGKQTYILLPEWEILSALIVTLKKQKEEGASPSIADAVRELRRRGVHIPKTAAEFEAEGPDGEEEEIHPTKPLTSKLLTSIPGAQSLNQWAEFPLESLIPKFWQSGMDMLAPLVERLTAQSIPFPAELAYLRILSAMAAEKYLVSTDELANLLKLKPDTIAAYGDRFEDAGFVFTRVGKRKNRQVAWRVSRLD